MKILHHERLFRSAEAMQRLADFPITICGAGALGANITESLARAGVGPLRVVDRDRVEEHNLSTQPYIRGDIGSLKARQIAHHIYRAIGVSVEALPTTLEARNVRKLLKSSALVIDAFDNSGSRALLKTHCDERGIPCLHAGLAGDYAEVIWNEHYRVPSPAQDDICDYPLARNLVMLAVAVTCEVAIGFALHSARRDFTITLNDFAICPLKIF